MSAPSDRRLPLPLAVWGMLLASAALWALLITLILWWVS